MNSESNETTENIKLQEISENKEQELTQEFIKQITQQLDCPICFSLFKEPVTIQCGHNFCKPCIKQHLKTTPKCPICRVPITQNPAQYSENVLIRAIVQDFKSSSKTDETQKQPKQQQQQQQQQQNERLIVIYTDSVVIPHIYQRLWFDRSQFHSLGNNQIKQIFQEGGRYLLINNNSKQKQEIIGYYVNLQQVFLIGNKIQAQVLCKDRMDVLSLEMQEFSTGNDLNKLTYQLPLAECRILQDEEIDLQDPEIKKQISTLVQQIRDFLTPFIYQQHQDNTTAIVQTYLAQSGLLMYLQNDLTDDIVSLRRFSYILPGIIRFPLVEKQKIVLNQNLIQRLMLVSKNLNRFQNIHNPLMVFQIGDDGMHGIGKKEITIIVIILLVIILLNI